MVKSPYSYFGGKSRVAPIIWQGFGKISNYIEPFAGSLAVLLANPHPCKIETVNDISYFIPNFWRAVSQDPEGVAKFADYPVHETELHARHRWILSAADEEFKRKMQEDVDFYDMKMAGYWVWGMGASVGNNWLQPKGLNAAPLLSSAGGGIHGLTQEPLAWLKKLQERTRRVRVTCGDWKKIITPGITYASKGLGKSEITGVFLDPPYDADMRDKVYQQDHNVSQEVFDWAIANGDNPKMRIIVCGYEGTYQVPDSWQTYHWTGNGMGNMSNARGKDNLSKERIYFSPHCLKIL